MADSRFVHIGPPHLAFLLQLLEGILLSVLWLANNMKVSEFFLLKITITTLYRERK
jgi:hypothetical protein